MLSWVCVKDNLIKKKKTLRPVLLFNWFIYFIGREGEEKKVYSHLVIHCPQRPSVSGTRLDQNGESELNPAFPVAKQLGPSPYLQSLSQKKAGFRSQNWASESCTLMGGVGILITRLSACLQEIFKPSSKRNQW